jgi:hypothetical protein
MNRLFDVRKEIEIRKRQGNLQLWSAILLIVWQLLLANPAQIPEDHSAVIASTAKDSFFEWVPSEGGD